MNKEGEQNTDSQNRRELNCIFKLEETLKRRDISIDEKYRLIVEMLPESFSYPEIIGAQLTINNKVFKTKNFRYSPWVLSYPIVVQGEEIGALTISYRKNPDKRRSPFSDEEKKLLETIANRLSHFVLYQDLKNIFADLSSATHHQKKPDWQVILSTLRKIDPPLFMQILRKILQLLLAKNVEDSKRLMEESFFGDEEESVDENRPLKRKKINTYDDYINEIISLAHKHLYDSELRNKIEEWLLLNKAVPLIKTLESESTSLTEISEAIRKYFHLAPEKVRFTESLIKGLRVSLLRRFFSEDLRFISVAKEYVRLTDFYDLIDKMIFMPSSHGKLGGKSSGLFVASRIIQSKTGENELLREIKHPKTWYMASDGILAYMHYNDLEEMLEYKYKAIDEIRFEYDHIVQMFKNAQFPPELIHGLSLALDDFGDSPIIVRSSSLLEDQIGASFSGKYKSLFLANQGSKEERLENLMDAIAEVYASTFGPDPIEYRAEKGLLDFHEEMAVMIQEVVGTRIGKYYLPSFAGVAFSNNEFRWSPRIKRTDGVVRIVPGLGTRAVDRVGDDYPILAAPGQPNLRVNVTFEEAVRYSPKNVDVINLETNTFETISFEKLVREYGDDYPAIEKIISVIEHKTLRQPSKFTLDFSKDDFVITFEGLFKEQKFLQKIDAVLHTLQKAFKSPVDIEFASDGEDLYLLQCRPQSFMKEEEPDEIPKKIPESHLLFKASKYVSNGKLKDIQYIVYVDPIKYAEAESYEKLVTIGKIIGKLNNVLPRRKFILIGPGRWGSKGDIKLGVKVTYSDINNTAMLVEVAKKSGNYTPDLSFGTHFFQDLVEAEIRYLPLYPDEEDGFLNEKFIESAENSLPDLLPDYKDFAEFVKVIDFSKLGENVSLTVLMNAEVDEAVAIIEGEGYKIDFVENDKCKKKKLTFEKLADNLALQVKHMNEIEGLYVREYDNKLNIFVKNSGSEGCVKKWLEGWFSAVNLMFSSDNKSNLELQIIFNPKTVPNSARKIK